MKELIFTFIFLALIILLSATYKDPQIVNYLRQQVINNNKNSTINKSMLPNTTVNPENTISINIGNQGFSPQILTIKSYTKVILNNKTNLDSNIISNNINDIKIGIIKPFTSTTIIFKNPGTYNYYNKTRPEEKETIIVK